MTAELAHFLRQAVEHCGQQDIEIQPEYYGRGMGDKSTVGVIVENVPRLVLDVLEFIASGMEMGGHEGRPEHIPSSDDIAGLMLRQDNIANRTILY